MINACTEGISMGTAVFTQRMTYSLERSSRSIGFDTPRTEIESTSAKNSNHNVLHDDVYEKDEIIMLPDGNQNPWAMMIIPTVCEK
jgi:hypothetical protein